MCIQPGVSKNPFTHWRFFFSFEVLEASFPFLQRTRHKLFATHLQEQKLEGIFNIWSVLEKTSPNWRCIDSISVSQIYTIIFTVYVYVLGNYLNHFISIEWITNDAFSFHSLSYTCSLTWNIQCFKNNDSDLWSTKLLYNNIIQW